MEIERKFLLQEPPEKLYAYPATTIEQGYIIVTESEELRIRRRGLSYTLTFKKGSGTTRDEIEVEITREQYEEFRLHVIGVPIHKKRIDFPYGDHTMEIDIYKDALEGLAVAEVEFPSRESMQDFSPPDWLGEDVSCDAGFKNKNLALQGLPASLLRKWKDASRPPWHFEQSGAVPFRKKDAGCEVLLVTTRKAGRWIIPKGIVEPDLSPADSAVKEALEEAGVSGIVMHEIQSSYYYDKWNGRCAVTLFPLQVTEEHEHWREEGVRERRWVAQEHLGDYVESAGLKEAVLQVLDRLYCSGK
ncbi:MAG: NUDIX domain-containing protein [Actinobacteria bacterium]|jgi:CYTH domain-containing protein/ADP-ribose pyrophosphatase YjhB (NUDIX family)|nr:MAG: NUDIX domain-containing protein [Actinomycetota bacterium]